MRSTAQSTSRRNVAIALAAAVFGASMGTPAPATAGPQQQAGKLACNPMAALCDIQYLYYADATLTDQVGFADDDCGAGYVLHWGVETDHVKMRYWECPF